MRKLSLETSWSKSANRAATEEDVLKAISQMRDDEDFVILSVSDLDYVQSMPGVVEYRNAGRHFRCVLDASDNHSTKSAFLCYFRDEPLTSILPWQDVTDELNQNLNRLRPFLAFFVLAALVTMLWLYLRR